MPTPQLRFEGVWKKFRKGEVHDSLRDLIPSLARGSFRGRETTLGTRDFWALSDVSFEVRPGEALGIIGPNGAGKSTTLKLLARILQPTLGRVTVSGRVGAMIELAAGFHGDLSGRENVYLQGAIMGMPQREIRTKFDAIVAFSGVEEFIDTPVKRYSSGMNARLGFAIAAHLDPDVLLIDEVLSVGDVSFQQRCQARLREIRSAGTPIVFVSHNLQAVGGLCERALLLRRGLPPLLGEVQEMTQAYLAGATEIADDRIQIVSSSLTGDAQDGPVTAPVSPGDWLRLNVRLRCRAPLGRVGVSLVVDRSDNVRVFDGVLTPRPGDLVELEAGTELEVSVRFRANLLRGVFMAGLVLFEEGRRTAHVRLHGLVTFNVADQNRWAGFAELEPVAVLRLFE